MTVCNKMYGLVMYILLKWKGKKKKKTKGKKMENIKGKDGHLLSHFYYDGNRNLDWDRFV